MGVLSNNGIHATLRDESGSALIVTLLVIATLAGLTLAFSEDAGVELNLAGYARDRYRAYLSANSGIQLALESIATDPDWEMDNLNEEWAMISTAVFPGGLPEDVSMAGQVRDESGKFNLNVLLNAEGKIDPTREQQLLRLFTALQLEEDQAAPVLDWLDRDDVERMNGAENAYYRSLSTPFSATNGPFVTAAQLGMVKGMQGGGLQDHITVYSDGLININTASREVIRCLSPRIDDALAEAIIDFRSEQDILFVDDLKKVAGMNTSVFNEIRKWISVKSNAFSMTFEGSCRDTRAGISAVAVRNENQVFLVYWRVD